MPLDAAPAQSRPDFTRRGTFAFLVLLAAFVAMPWLVRPLESLLPLVDVALVGNIAESAIGFALGAWLFRMKLAEVTELAVLLDAAAYEKIVEAQ